MKFAQSFKPNKINLLLENQIEIIKSLSINWADRTRFSISNIPPPFFFLTFTVSLIIKPICQNLLSYVATFDSTPNSWRPRPSNQPPSELQSAPPPIPRIPPTALSAAPAASRRTRTTSETCPGGNSSTPPGAPPPRPSPRSAWTISRSTSSPPRRRLRATEERRSGRGARPRDLGRLGGGRAIRRRRGEGGGLCRGAEATLFRLAPPRRGLKLLPRPTGVRGGGGLYRWLGIVLLLLQRIRTIRERGGGGRYRWRGVVGRLFLPGTRIPMRGRGGGGRCRWRGIRLATPRCGCFLL